MRIGAALNPQHEHSLALLSSLLEKTEVSLLLTAAESRGSMAPTPARTPAAGHPLTRLARGLRARLEIGLLREDPLWDGPSWVQMTDACSAERVIASGNWAEIAESIRDLDLVIMAGFSQMVPEIALSAPRLGWVNLHPSLLPAYRGSHPLFWALFDCADFAGVTAYVVGPGLDDGSILAQESFPILTDDTYESAYRRAIRCTGSIVDEVLNQATEALERGTCLQGVPQDMDETPPRKPPTEEDMRVDWNEPANLLACRIGHLHGDLWFEFDTRRIVLHEATCVDATGVPGTVLSVADEGVLFATSKGGLLVRRMDVGGVWSRHAARAARGIGLEAGMQL